MIYKRYYNKYVKAPNSFKPGKRIHRRKGFTYYLFGFIPLYSYDIEVEMV